MLQMVLLYGCVGALPCNCVSMAASGMQLLSSMVSRSFPARTSRVGEVASAQVGRQTATKVQATTWASLVHLGMLQQLLRQRSTMQVLSPQQHTKG